MKRSVLLFIIIPFLLNSCLPDCEENPQGSLPETPVNLEEFNSEYDDYNSTAVPLGAYIPFCFSTNRDSEGENFDIVFEPMSINLDKNTGDITVANNYDSWGNYHEDFKVLQDAMDTINSEGNELGPYFILNTSSYFRDYDFLFLYASDVGGDFQIGFTYSYNSPEFNEGQEVEFLNSTFDDLYPSFNMYYNTIYFCSNRDNEVFNIYSTSLIRSSDKLVAELSDNSPREITLNEILSSDYNDKCPFIFGRLMVFASDRPGGEGGFDLYYSIYNNGTWGEPVNFGPEINTAYDEYRPILVSDVVDYYKDMMIFSSNRPGGSGGFDLYYLGID